MLSIGDYSVRRIQEEDLKLLLEWRNSERVRRVMLQQHVILWEEHIAWYQRVKDIQPPCNLIFQYKGRDIGYMGYNGFDAERHTCVPGSYLGDNKGLPLETGLALFLVCNRYAFDVLKVDCLISPILVKNEASIKMNYRLGFQKMKENEIPSYVQDISEPVVTLYLTRDMWEKNCCPHEAKVSVHHV